MKLERILSEQQQREREEKQKKEDKRRLEELSNNKRERGLNDMMNGVLQVKREDVLAIVYFIVIIIVDAYICIYN